MMIGEYEKEWLDGEFKRRLKPLEDCIEVLKSRISEMREELSEMKGSIER